MNKDIHSAPSKGGLPEAGSVISESTRPAARDAAERAKQSAEDIIEITKGGAKRTTEMAREAYRSASAKAEETLAVSKDYVRRNPVPSILGALAFGVALGSLVMAARRRPTFGERYADEPLGAVREAILGALSPATRRVHDGYDSARDGVGKAIDRVHRFGRSHKNGSFSGQMGRIGNNLKFW